MDGIRDANSARASLSVTKGRLLPYGTGKHAAFMQVEACATSERCRLHMASEICMHLLATRTRRHAHLCGALHAGRFWADRRLRTTAAIGAALRRLSPLSGSRNRPRPRFRNGTPKSRNRSPCTHSGCNRRRRHSRRHSQVRSRRRRPPTPRGRDGDGGRSPPTTRSSPWHGPLRLPPLRHPAPLPWGCSCSPCRRRRRRRPLAPLPRRAATTTP
mmetsp:Transcript_78285/g.217376  ORF Transcript_78285/g.217376 Transcript_78285/m.217376 type:complete len:215 (+) Transcript_78285:245-889(+)